MTGDRCGKCGATSVAYCNGSGNSWNRTINGKATLDYGIVTGRVIGDSDAIRTICEIIKLTIIITIYQNIGTII